MLLSVIVPVRNGETHILRCLESLKMLEAFEHEVLIKDGGSSDGTLDLIQRFIAEHPTFHLYSGKDNGIYNAINQMLRISKGTWIYILGSDDMLLDASVFPRLYGKGFEETALVYGNVHAPSLSESAYNGSYDLGKLIENNICQQAVIYRKTLFQSMGLFDERFRLHADYVFHLYCFVTPSVHHHYIGKTIAFYQGEASSASGWDIRFVVFKFLFILRTAVKGKGIRFAVSGILAQFTRKKRRKLFSSNH